MVALGEALGGSKSSTDRMGGDADGAAFFFKEPKPANSGTSLVGESGGGGRALAVSIGAAGGEWAMERADGVGEAVRLARLGVLLWRVEVEVESGVEDFSGDSDRSRSVHRRAYCQRDAGQNSRKSIAVSSAYWWWVGASAPVKAKQARRPKRGCGKHQHQHHSTNSNTTAKRDGRTGSACGSLRTAALDFLLQFAKSLGVFTLALLRQLADGLEEGGGVEVLVVFGGVGGRGRGSRARPQIRVNTRQRHCDGRQGYALQPKHAQELRGGQLASCTCTHPRRCAWGG